MSTAPCQFWEETGPCWGARGAWRRTHTGLLRGDGGRVAPRGKWGADTRGEGAGGGLPTRRWRGGRQAAVVRPKRRAVEWGELGSGLLAGEAGKHLGDGVAGQLLGGAVFGRRRHGRGGGGEVPGGQGLVLQLRLALKLVAGGVETLVDPSLVGGLVETWAAQTLGQHGGGDRRGGEGGGGGAGGRQVGVGVGLRVGRGVGLHGGGQTGPSPVLHPIFRPPNFLGELCLSGGVEAVDL